MSQQSSSADSLEARPISEQEMRLLLRQYFAGDSKPDLIWELSHRLKDPFAESKDGGFRMHPLWLSLGLLALTALSVFLYFTFWR